MADLGAGQRGSLDYRIEPRSLRPSLVQEDRQLPDQTVTLTDQEWNQLTAILANATGYLVLTKLFNQLQAQAAPTDFPSPQKGDGLDLDLEQTRQRRVPRTQ